jgi:protein-L-isoaspartate(D-aspartate) O-methyltransferase
MTSPVVTVDIDQDLVDAAREHLLAAGFDRVQVVCADGGYGYADAAPLKAQEISMCEHA